MNLLMIATVDFNYHGIPIAIMNNYRLFNHHDVHCTFITNVSMDYDFKDEINENGDIIYVLPNRKKATLLYIRYLRQIAKKGDFDLAHINGNSSTMVFELIALRGIVPSICQAHTTSSEYTLLHRTLFPLFDHLIMYKAACSKEAGVFLFRNEKFMTLKNGIDENKFVFVEELRIKVRKELRIENNDVLLHVGSFNDVKNHSFLIELFNEYIKYNPKAILILVGDGPLIGRIKNMVFRLKIQEKIIFVGQSNRLNEYMMASDCFLLPSKYESFGIVNIEAQTTGLPCIVSTTVPDGAKISENYYSVDLEKKEEWIRYIDICLDISKKSNRLKGYENLYESDFSSSFTAKELMDYYLMIAKNEFSKK